ncbi:hypothetical protein BD410DRAFT_643061 [Rickenella mellea]|uniref:NACHT domain-containing protein n=1 Tax=Rickenella mellea TaxID=50990 RepID=A0A4Y7PMK9_9AGAM|nr:hypothetical protein BD410DRAFT_643061 [Rickenella mellea]
MSEEDIEKYFDKIPRVEAAAYNSSQRDFRTGCLSGTRDYLLSAVHEWVQRPTPPLFWLNGLAGTGKTTIAHSVAEYYDERKQLGASFFFSRDQQDRRDTRQVISTIAYQLGKAYPEVEGLIATAIKNHNPLHSNSQTQLRRLIIEPLSSLPHQRSLPTVIVIDALDESDDHTAASNIVELLATELPRTPLPLKFFVTSRPEKDLRSRFLAETVSSETQTLILHDIDVGIVQKDIKLFLQVRLTGIAKKHRDVIPQKPSKWPTEAEVDALTERAGGLFIFASTVVGFLDESSFLAPQRLSSILNEKVTASSSNLNPYAMLDKLYYQILDFMLHAGPHPIEDTADMFRRVVGTILFLRQPASCDDLIALLNTNVKGALMHLHSVIKVPKEDEGTQTIEIFHKSFHDYLTDPARCTDHHLFIDPPVHHGIIAESCLNVMIHSLESFLSTSIYIGYLPDFDKIPPFLHYACSEWTEHGLMCRHDDKLFDLAQIFFSTTSLNWIMYLALTDEGLIRFMHLIEQAARLGLVWSPFLSISLQHLGGSLSSRPGANRDYLQCRKVIQSSSFASILAVGIPPADPGCYFACAFADILSPFSMISFPEINDRRMWNFFELEWLEIASVCARPGSPAETAYYHILGCITFHQCHFELSVSWFQRALPVDVPDHGHSFEVLRDMVAARCNGARLYQDFLDDMWHLPLWVVDSYIRTLQRVGVCRADVLFTLGNLYWMRFQLVDNTPNPEDIDISIQHLQNAANASPQNFLRCASLQNLGYSLCMRYEFYGSPADIDAAEQCLRESEAQCDPKDAESVNSLPRDLGYAMYKSFKLRGQFEDIAKSIWYLTMFLTRHTALEVRTERHNSEVGRDRDEAYDALRKLERNNPGAGAEIWRCCHNPKIPLEVEILKRMTVALSCSSDEANSGLRI